MRPLAFALSANLSQRSPKARRSAAISGELVGREESFEAPG
jgi:hypothetical protein